MVPPANVEFEHSQLSCSTLTVNEMFSSAHKAVFAPDASLWQTLCCSHKATL